MEQFTQIFREATAAVPAEFFLLPIHRGDSVYRERVYCYELYHQLMSLWPIGCAYRLNGEVDKRAHPYFQDGLQPKPDLLVHRPGTRENYAIIEVKSHSVVRRDIDKDLGTLTLFKTRLGYARAIYLIYGANALDVRDQVQRRVAAFADIAPFELWLHSRVGMMAEN